MYRIMGDGVGPGKKTTLAPGYPNIPEASCYHMV